VEAAEWQLAGIGDFNADGWADALLLRGDGLLRVDTTNGDLVTVSHIVGRLEPGWQIVGVGDINNDGTSDILLRNDNGTYQAELIQNNTVAATVDLALVDGQWQVIAPTGVDASPSDSPPVDPPITPPTPPTPHPVIVDDGYLSQAELDWFVDAAIARWSAAGLTPEQIAVLEQVTFSVGDMAGLYLGSFAPGVITLDSDGAGQELGKLRGEHRILAPKLRGELVPLGRRLDMPRAACDFFLSSQLAQPLLEPDQFRQSLDSSLSQFYCK
jgi:hypothetical protein